MSSPNDFPDFSAEALVAETFKIVLDNVRKRMVQAIEQDTGDGKHVYWSRDWVTGPEDDIGIITLASDYTDVIEGNGEAFELGLPVASIGGTNSDKLEFIEPAEGAYFIWRKRRNSEAVIINADNYSELFESDEPLVERFGSKVWEYSLIPTKMERIA